MQPCGLHKRPDPMTTAEPPPRETTAPHTRIAAALRIRPVLTRWLLAGPGAILLAVATLAAMPVWLPAGVNTVSIPVVAAPLVWAAAFFYACLAEDVAKAATAMLAATAIQAALLAIA